MAITVQLRMPRILIVEEQFIVAADLALQIKKMGFWVEGFSRSGIHALQFLDQEVGTIDLVLLATHFNGQPTGITIANQIRLQYAIPIIFLTAGLDRKDLLWALQAQPQALISLPFNPLEIFEEMDRVFRESGWKFPEGMAHCPSPSSTANRDLSTIFYL